MTSLKFNSVLLEVSEQLGSQLDQMKFLIPRELIGKNRLEKIDTGCKLFQVLMERNKLGPDNTELLCSLLTQIHREDLVEKINNYESDYASGLTNNQPDEKERGKLDIATEMIAEALGRHWRKMGRKLGLSEVKLDSIDKRHPTDLEETVRELLKEWRKGRGSEARAEDLVQALRDCQLNLTADNVEQRLLENTLLPDSNGDAEANLG